MRINRYQNDNLTENYLDLYYNMVDSEVVAVLDLFHAEKKLIGKSDEAEEVINIADIYYFEIVDRKCFAYLRSGVFNVELNLQAILERFRDDGFLRISKSMVVNVFKLVQIKSDINMKVHALLENGETVIVNRSYKRSFYSSMKALLKMEEQYETNS